MALTPLPSNTTRRYFLQYQAGGLEHTFQVRSTETISDAEAIGAFQTQLAILKPRLYSDVAFYGIERADLGSDIRNPLTGWTVVPGTNAFATPDNEKAYTISFRGRSATGRKVKNLLFGCSVARQPDWEVTPDVTDEFHTFIANALNGSARLYMAIDGSKPVWKPNLLLDYNDHWEKELRP